MSVITTRNQLRMLQNSLTMFTMASTWIIAQKCCPACAHTNMSTSNRNFTWTIKHMLALSAVNHKMTVFNFLNKKIVIYQHVNSCTGHTHRARAALLWRRWLALVQLGCLRFSHWLWPCDAKFKGPKKQVPADFWTGAYQGILYFSTSYLMF